MRGLSPKPVAWTLRLRAIVGAGMYLTMLEHALGGLGLGAVRLVLRAAGLLFLAAMWTSGVLMRLAIRPLLGEVARALGRLCWQWQLATRATSLVRSATGVGRD